MVRVAPGRVAPATPTSGYSVYKGRGGRATKSGLSPSTTYTFAVFAVDTEGKVSPRKIVSVGGSKLTLSASAASITYGAKFELRGKAGSPG